MVVELLSVGTELLLGNIVNTNAAYLAEKCALLGLSMYRQSVVGDNGARLEEAFRLALGRSDVVLLTGGLGPTQDDLTKETVARALGKTLVPDEAAKAHIAQYFKKLGAQKIPESNWKQALVPEGAIALENENGTAPGIYLEADGKTVVLLPGPPGEMIPMFEASVAPRLKEKCPQAIVSAMVKLCGIGESAAEERIRDLIDRQGNPTIAPYAKTGEVHLRVTARAKDEKEAKKLLRPVVKELKERFGDHVYTCDEEVTLEQAVLSLLRGRGLTLTTAESLTGGLLCARLTGVPGASDVLRQGFVTYSNRAKRKILDVKKSTLKEYGAVSEKTAKEMAKNGAFITGADVCVSLTGIAGPDAVEGKPVGLVYIACSYNGKSRAQEFHFNGNRAKIREGAVAKALAFLRAFLLEEG